MFQQEVPQPHLYQHIIVPKCEPKIALLSDRVIRVFSGTARNLVRVSEDVVFRDSIEGDLSIDGDSHHLINMTKLLLVTEQNKIEAFRQLAHDAELSFGASEVEHGT